MLEQISDVLTEKCQLNKGTTVLIGASGGPDSLFLLDILQQLDYHLIVAHLDHGLRLESGIEREKIEKVAKGYGLPFVSRRVDVLRYANENHLSVEEAARTLRYEFLFEQAGIAQADAVAVGHNANDQVETVLMHLLRGAGASGLGGMGYRFLPNPWSAAIPLVRPLLGIWRDDISVYLWETGLEPSYDESNQDYRYYRNRLRGETLPYLETLNSGVHRRLWKTAELLRTDNEVLEQLIDRLWDKAILKAADDYLVIDRDFFQVQHLSLQRRLIRRAIRTLCPDLRNLDFATIDLVVEMTAGEMAHGQRIELVGNLRMWREGREIWLAKAEAELESINVPALFPNTSLWLEPPARLELSNGWWLECQELPAEPEKSKTIRDNQDRWQSWLDLDRVTLPLQLRGRVAGDRIRLLGLGDRSQKLSDFMINVKLPQRLRADWPLVVSGDEIVWLVGYAVSERFAVRPETKRLLHLKLNHERPAG